MHHLLGILSHKPNISPWKISQIKSVRLATPNIHLHSRTQRGKISCETFNIIQWNTGSVNVNRYNLIILIRKFSSNIALQETWLIPTFNFQFHTYSIIRQGRREGKIGVLEDANYEDLFNNLEVLLPTVYRLIACFSSHPCLCLVLWKVVSPSFSMPSSAMPCW